MRILIVDDEPDVVRALAKWLTSLGHAVDSVGDGAAGLERMRATVYGLVILDVMLPGMSGIEVAQAKLRDACIARTPVVILSGMDPVEVEAMCDRANPAVVGITKILTKPVSLDAIDRIITSLASIAEIE